MVKKNKIKLDFVSNWIYINNEYLNKLNEEKHDRRRNGYNRGLLD